MKKGSAYVVSAISATLIIFLCDLVSGFIVNFLYDVIENSNGILLVVVAMLLRIAKIIFFVAGVLAIIMICNALEEKSKVSTKYLCIIAGIFIILVYLAIAFIAIEAGESAGTPSYYALAAIALFGYGKVAKDEEEPKQIETIEDVNPEANEKETTNNTDNELNDTNVEAESAEASGNVENVAMSTENSDSSEQNADSNSAADTASTGEVRKIRYCKFCGGVIDGKTKRCTSCGKSANPLRRMLGSKRAVVEVMALVLILAVATGGYIAQKKYYELKMESIQDTLNYKSKRITSLSADVKKYRARANEYKDKADFMDDYIVIVPDDGTNLYHSYGCSKLDTSSFWAFNTEAAKGEGYKPCSKCQ